MNAKPPRNFFLAHLSFELANFMHGIGSQTGHAVAFAPRRSFWGSVLAVFRTIGSSAFAGAVALIFSLSPNPQMGGIAARRVIATMANDKTFRDWTVMQFVRYATSNIRNAFSLNAPMPEMAFRSKPYPTIVGDLHPRPKVFYQNIVNHGGILRNTLDRRKGLL